MTRLLERIQELKKIGGSEYLLTPKDFQEACGFDEEDELIVAVENGKHGNYLVAHIKGEQPDITQIEKEETEAPEDSTTHEETDTTSNDEEAR